MAQNCYAAGCVVAGRVALVDECTNVAIPGANNGYIFDGIIEATWEPEVEEGENTTVKTMCGDICVRDVQCDQTVGANVTLKLCRPDNELNALVTGESRVLNDDGDTIGYVQIDDTNCSPFVALELWEKIPESECSAIAVYRRLIFPKIRLQQAAPDREGPIRLYNLQGTAEAGYTSGYSDSPFHDSPVDFNADFTGDKFFWSEVYDTILPVAQCGTVTVPA